MGNVKDYRVKITVRNNYLLTAMDNAGIGSIAELARRCKRSTSSLYLLAQLKLSAFKEDGTWREALLDAATVLNCTPGDLIPPQHWEKAMPINSGEVEMGMEEVAGLLGPQYSRIEAIPDLRIERNEAMALVLASLDTLKERERYAITRYHGLDGDPPENFVAIAKHFDRSRTTAEGIYERGLSRLRTTTMSRPLRDALESMFTTDI